VKNYDGSWIEWANDPFFPIEAGVKVSAIE
jgi:3-mercaptopyruvate sulfurtransferase SseA